MNQRCTRSTDEIREDVATARTVIRDNITWNAMGVIGGMCDRVEELLTRVTESEAKCQALEAERAWLPIETAPKDGTEILLHHWYDYNNDGNITHVVTAGFYDDSSVAVNYPWCTLLDSIDFDSPERNKDNKCRNHEQMFTSWMPLPQPPTTKGD